jgi:phosphate transport system protein
MAGRLKIMRNFEEKIQELQQKLLLMGRLAESMIQTALRILIERDESLGIEVFEKEKEVNELQIEIDDSAVKLTALQQPVGADVRFLFMASRIATELERIGDQAVNIIHRTRACIDPDLASFGEGRGPRDQYRGRGYLPGGGKGSAPPV